MRIAEANEGHVRVGGRRERAARHGDRERALLEASRLEPVGAEGGLHRGPSAHVHLREVNVQVFGAKGPPSRHAFVGEPAFDARRHLGVAPDDRDRRVRRNVTRQSAGGGHRPVGHLDDEMEVLQGPGQVERARVSAGDHPGGAKEATSPSAGRQTRELDVAHLGVQRQAVACARRRGRDVGVERQRAGDPVLSRAHDHPWRGQLQVALALQHPGDHAQPTPEQMRWAADRHARRQGEREPPEVGKVRVGVGGDRKAVKDVRSRGRARIEALQREVQRASVESFGEAASRRRIRRHEPR